MSLQLLLQIMPAPLSALGSNPELWPQVESNLGLALPTDYKRFIDLYGAGMVFDELFIVSPFTKTNTLAKPDYLTSWALQEGAEYRECHNRFPEECPFPIYPDAGGLLAIGGDQTCNSLFYRTEGTPDEWPLVLYDDDYFNYETYEESVTGFLVRWIRGDLHSGILSDDFSKNPHRFGSSINNLSA